MALGAIVLTGPILRAVLLFLALSPHQIQMMMPSHFDTLAFGSLLAVLHKGNSAEQAWGQRLTKLGFWIGSCLMILSIFAADKNLVAPTVIFAELASGLSLDH